MSSSLDYLELCRLCLVKDRVSVPIFEDEGDVRQIFLKITACLPVKVSREDKLPKKICDDCVYKVELFYQFWNTTANAEKQLLQWLGEVGGLEDKPGYVTEVLDTNVMKQETSSDSRLDGSVMQVGGHQNNMDMGMMDIITMPAGSEQQFTSVPMDTGGTVQTVQVVPGPSTQTTHDQMAQSQTSHLVGEESEEENSDDGCDNEEGLPVKEENDDHGDQPLETTFVALPCDEAGPSGLQQQKISELSEMSMQQTADNDPKTGSTSSSKPKTSSGRGIFIFERESLVMRKWQILEFDGKPYYAFVPEDELPIKEDLIPELPDDVDEPITAEDDDEDQVVEREEQRLKEEVKSDAVSADDEQDDLVEETLEPLQDVKPRIVNGKVIHSQSAKSTTVKQMLNKSVVESAEAGSYGDLYQVKVEAGVLTLEKLNVEAMDTSDQQQQDTIQASAPSSPEVQEQVFEDESQDFEGFEVVNLGGEIAEPPPAQSDHDEFEDEVTEEARKPRGTTSGQHNLKCKACSETFETTLAFRKHVAWTHKKKVCIQEGGMFICSVCDFRTQKKALFATHLQRKHETWTRKRQNQAAVFPCAVCGFVCRSKHSLQSHFIRKHTDRYEHQCKFCPKKFKVKGDLTNHVRFHHKEKPVNCDVCGKLCLNSGSLYVHQKWAHYKPKYECTICKRRMVTQQNLDQHMVMQHEKREKIVCAECGKTFTKKDSFKRHMSVHTGNKPYCCVICNKPFARGSQLRQHLLIHTGKRPFVCDICGKAFTQKPGLISHRKTHPGNHPPLPVMPIGDIVKEFTEEYLASNQQAGNSEHREMLESLVDEPEEDEEEEEEEDEEYEEEYEECLEQQEIIEEDVLGGDALEDKME